jgi:hypothetical protein
MIVRVKEKKYRNHNDMTDFDYIRT